MRNDVSFCEKQRVVLRETTCRFVGNNGLFWEKRRLVLWKTTARFKKQRVVLRETTCRFLERNGGDDTEKCKWNNGEIEL